MLIKIILLLAVLLSVFSHEVVSADDFKLSIIYTKGEKGKDSHSNTTKIDINGKDVSYSIKYSDARDQIKKMTKSFAYFQMTRLKRLNN